MADSLCRGCARLPSKEKKFAWIEWPFQANSSLISMGRIGLRFEDGSFATWRTNRSGRGQDGSQCILPVQGWVPDFSEIEVFQRQVKRLAADLDVLRRGVHSRMSQLETRINDVTPPVASLVGIVDSIYQEDPAFPPILVAEPPIITIWERLAIEESETDS